MKGEEEGQEDEELREMKNRFNEWLTNVVQEAKVIKKIMERNVTEEEQEDEKLKEKWNSFNEWWIAEVLKEGCIWEDGVGFENE